MAVSFSNLGKMGRLGNCLYQAACAISLALENNDHYIFPKWEHEKDFNLQFCFDSDIVYKNVYKEPFFHYKKIEYCEDVDLVGYFASEKYFKPYKDVIIDLLTPKHEVAAESGICGIHVRRGDYLGLKDCYTQLGMDYYSAAMKVVGCDKFLVFSDDIKWCKENFKGKRFEFVEGNKPVVDLAIMAKRCEHMIIANSSFSWWGAYLNKNTDKIIVAPDKWFGQALSYNSSRDLVPVKWIKI